MERSPGRQRQFKRIVPFLNRAEQTEELEVGNHVNVREASF